MATYNRLQQNYDNRSPPDEDFRERPEPQEPRVVPRVYVSQENNYSYKSAEQYGELIFVAKGDFRPLPNSLFNRALMAEIKSVIAEFDSDLDWLVLTGSPYVAAIIFLILGNRGVKKINILRWDNRKYEYEPMTLNIG